MSGSGPDLLAEECELFARYLTDEPPADYARERYRAAHRPGAEGDVGAGPVDAEDARLLSYARAGGVRLRMADVYARFVRPGALVRRKLVLMLAILETSPPTHRDLNTPRTGSTVGLLLATAFRVLRSGALLAAGLLVFRLTGRRRASFGPNPTERP